MRYVGLAVAVAVAIALASFPLYAGRLTPYIWHMPSGEWRGGRGEGYGTYVVVKGVVKSVNPEEGYMVVDGEKVWVRGDWKVETQGREEVVDSATLLEMLKPGLEVSVECRRSGRWGLMALSITAPGLHAEKVEEG